ncbi:hypothetical protein GCM10010435_50010 [Winogradskya consettensis]
MTALRIARREMSRAKGRSALVVAMIALPVCALGYAAASYDMFTLTPTEQVTRELGSADALLQPLLDGPVTQDATGEDWRPQDIGEHRGSDGLTEAGMLARLPSGSRVVPFASEEREFRTATGGLAPADAYEMDLGDPIHHGRVELIGGRAPAAPGEVAMSKAARARFGDTIQTPDGRRTWTSVGTVEFPADLGEVLVFALGGETPGSGTPSAWLADTPAPIGWDEVLDLNRSGIIVKSRAVLLNPPDLGDTDPELPGRLSLVPVVVGLAVLEIVLLAGPAFAVGARRRQRSLALIAANGGTRAHLRRIVLADGVLLGLAGAVPGLALAVVLAVVARPLAEQMLVGERAGGYRFDPPVLAGIAVLAVVTGLLAAAVPAVTAARTDVVTALAGRRGVVRAKRRWPVAGLVLAGLGAAAAAAGASTAHVTVIAAGLAVVQIGLVLCTPALVGVLAKLGGFLPPAPRIALRDTARNRAASAPAVSAVMAAVAGTVAIGVYLASAADQREQNHTPALPIGYVAATYAPGTATQARDAVAAALPDAHLTEIPVTVCPDDPTSTGCQLIPVRTLEQQCPGERNPPVTRAERDALFADPRCVREHITQGSGYAVFPSVVGGRDVVAAMTGASGADLDRAAATLARGGAVVTDPFLIDNGMVKVVISTPTSELGKSVPVPGYLLQAGPYAGSVLSPVIAHRAGFKVTAGGVVAATTGVPATTVTDRLNAALAGAGTQHAFVETGPENDNAPFLYMLAAASALITLGAAATATGLAAADGRADLATLAAVGAAPVVRRLLSLSQSGVIAGLGSVLGIAAGIGSAFAVLAATNLSHEQVWPAPTPYPLAVPWLHVVLILVVPLVAMLGAGLLTRSRLPVERRRPT